MNITSKELKLFETMQEILKKYDLRAIISTACAFTEDEQILSSIRFFHYFDRYLCITKKILMNQKMSIKLISH